MRQPGRQGWGRVGLLLSVALLSCKSAPRAREAPSAEPVHASEARPLPTHGFAPQPGAVIAEVDGIAVLALAAPTFASLSREQRLVAYWAAQAIAAGDPLAAEQGYRHNRQIVRLLRGILSRPQVAAAGLLPRIRSFARAVYLNHGIHDAVTGRKLVPSFTAAELRMAALGAQAAGANLGLQAASLEYGVRALDGPLFDPRVAAQRTVHGKDLTESAVNFYGGVTLRDLQAFHERVPRSSQLVKEESVVAERPYRLPAAADALDRALPFAAPPQRGVIESLSSFLRSGDPEAASAAEQAWSEAFGPADFFAGYFDTSADPRGRKAFFEGAVGAADGERDEVLQRLTQRPAVALFLISAAGAARPLRSFALTAPGKTALFAGAQEAAAQVRADRVLAALADPRHAAALSRCAPSLRLAALALRETSRVRTDGAPVLEEALAELNADLLAPGATALMPAPACRELWPEFAATQWLAAVAGAAGERIEDDRQRAAQLQIWWFTSKGAAAERRSSGRRYLTVSDAAKFKAAAAELRDQLQQIPTAGDWDRLRDLVEQHASRVDAQLREELVTRTKGIPRSVAVIPPRLEPVIQDGAVVDAQAAAVTDLDDQILRDWSAY